LRFLVKFSFHAGSQKSDNFILKQSGEIKHTRRIIKQLKSEIIEKNEIIKIKDSTLQKFEKERGELKPIEANLEDDIKNIYQNLTIKIDIGLNFMYALHCISISTSIFIYIYIYQMILIYLKNFLWRNDVKILIIGTATGGILQLVARKYLEKHPELIISKDKPITKKDSRPRRLPFPRGGAIVEITGIGIDIGVKVLLNILAEKGIILGMVATGGIVGIQKIPKTAVVKYLRDALPQNLPHLEAKRFIVIEGEKLYLDQCDNSLQYLIKILQDETIPFEKKEQIAHSIFAKYIDLTTPAGRLNFLLCIVTLICLFAIISPSSLYIIFQNLIRAIKEGKISKSMARYIIRKLKQKNISVDPELLDLVDA
jgi:hypothetical protein